MPFPTTIEELKTAGYKFLNLQPCRGCGAPMAWYLTPTRQNIPLDPDTFKPHWSTCPKADQFRKPRKGKKR